MKCWKCGSETDLGSVAAENDGRTVYCKKCSNDLRTKNLRRKAARQVREEAYAICGLVKVRGALGGIYWE